MLDVTTHRIIFWGQEIYTGNQMLRSLKNLRDGRDCDVADILYSTVLTN
jgi:hypothetical protein